MYTAHGAPPPIPPKPNSQERNKENNNIDQIDQLLTLLDSESQFTNTPPCSSNSTSHTSNPVSFPQPFISQPTGQNYYNSGPAPQIYNGGQPYYQGNQGNPGYHPNYPQGWPAQTNYQMPSSNQPIPTIHNQHGYTQYPNGNNGNSTYIPSNANSNVMPEYTRVSNGSNGSNGNNGNNGSTTYTPSNANSIVMPDFHSYNAGSSSNLQQNNSNYAPQKNSYPYEPYNAHPVDQTYNKSYSEVLDYSSSSNFKSQGSSWMQMPDYGTSSGIPSKDKKSYLDEKNPALLSYIALAFNANIKLGTHVKGALEYPDSFTGKDAVSTIYALLPINIPRFVALSMARSLEAQLYFHSINWATITVIKDTEDEVYAFLNPGTDSPSSPEWDEDFPTGVFPITSKCYSPRCGIDGKSCYSRTCINYVPGVDEKPPPPPVEPLVSPVSNVASVSEPASQAAQEQDRTWVGSVPKEILDALDKEERKRQEIIFETIYTEEDYVKDLDLLDTLFMKGLRESDPPIIPPAQLEEFIQAVFFNVFKIRTHNQKMLERLQKRQKENFVVESIGDIFCECAMEFGIDYIDYNGHFPIANNTINNAKQKNPGFKGLLEQCSRNKEARKLDFRHFVQRPTQRLQRYTLLLEQIIKHTNDANPDKGLLEGALQTIRDLCKTSDNRVYEAEQRLKILDLDKRLVKKNGEPCTVLKLLDRNRQILHRGELHKKSGLEMLDLYVFLFDHYLVMTKIKKTPDGDIRYIVSKKPIPLEMLIVDSSAENNQRTGTTFLSIGARDTARRKVSNPNPSFRDPQLVTDLEKADGKASNPFTIHHIGRHGQQYQLFADSANVRKMWKEKILEAQTKLQLNKSNSQVFELFALNDATFGTDQIRTSSGAAGSSVSKVKITCSVAFVTPEKRNMVAIGTEEGVWMGFGGEIKTFQKVLTIGNVMQMAVLEDFGIFIVLVERALWAYSLEALIPSSTSRSSNVQATRQKLCANSNVQYFNVGTVKDKTLLVYMKKKGLDSHFKALEPVVTVNAQSEKSKGSMSMSRKALGLLSSKNEWFREYRQYYIPSESYSVNFLRSKLCVVCTRGFEIVNLDTLQNGTIPDFTLPSFSQISRQCDGSKPLGMFRLSDNEFLLCYDAIFFYVDKHGELSRNLVVEWEGHPESVALQIPYVIGFNSSFIEIRDVEKGDLIQVIPGKNMRCLNDNSSGKQAIHAVMLHPFNDAYYIFQLVLSELRRKEHKELHQIK